MTAFPIGATIKRNPQSFSGLYTEAPRVMAAKRARGVIMGHVAGITGEPAYAVQWDDGRQTVEPCNWHCLA